MEYYGIDSDGTLGKAIKRVANQAVKYASDGAIDGLYKAESDSTEINSLLCAEIKWILHSLQDVHTPLNPDRFL